MNKKLKQDIRDSFNFPDAKHKYEFLTQAEVASAQEEKRKYTIPVVFRVTAAAAAAALAIGLWTNLRSNPDPSGGDFREGSVIVTEAVSAQPVTTSYTNDNGTAETSYNGASVTTAQAVTSYAGNNTAGTASPALGAGSQTTAHRSSGSRTTAAVTGRIPTTATTVINKPERSFEMKKLAAFLSAFTLSVSAIATDSHAAYSVANDRYPSEKQGINNIDKYNMVTDLDQDGKSDLMDGCILYRYLIIEQGDYDEIPEAERPWSVNNVSDEINEYIAQNADYDKDGTISHNDVDTLICYYFIHNKVSYKDILPTTYDPSYSGPIHGYHLDECSVDARFTEEVNSEVNQLLITYYLIDELIDDGLLDLDVDENGRVDIIDYAYLSIDGQNYLDTYTFPVEDGIGYSQRPYYLEMPAYIQTNCDNVYLAKPLMYLNKTSRNTEVSHFLMALEEYFAAHLTIIPEYFDDDYYESIIEGSDTYSLGSNLRKGAKRMDVIPSDADSSFFNIDNEVFAKSFTKYYNNVLNGKQPAPDVNKDGTVNSVDSDLAFEYIGEILGGHTDAPAKMSKAAWSALKNDFDLDQNGTSGDIYDLFFIAAYAAINEEAPDSADTVASYRYNSGLSMLSTAEIDRSGDANCDGETDLADAIFIMQSMANPDKYNISERGRFNGDVYETGHGITANDALEIQNTLLHKDN